MILSYAKYAHNRVRTSTQRTQLCTLAISVLLFCVFTYGSRRMSPAGKSLEESEHRGEPASSTERVLFTLLRSLRSHGARLLLTQTVDLLDEEAFLRSSLLNQDVALTRVGVLEENLTALLNALDDVMGRNFTNVSRKDIRAIDPRASEKEKAAKGDGKRPKNGLLKMAF